MNREIGQKGVNVQFQLSIPLDGKGNVNASVNKNTDGKYNYQTNYSRTAPIDGGLGWQLSYADGYAPYRQADLTWKTRYTQLQGGMYGRPGQASYWGRASGSVIWMDSALYPTTQVSDAFVLVSSHPDTPVRYENQRIGKTDAKGHLLIPQVQAYYPGKFEVDTMDLPGNVSVPVVEQRLAVRSRSGALLKFPAKVVTQMNLVLQDTEGNVLPRGSKVTVQDSSYQTYVGWDGATYLEDVSAGQVITVNMPDGAQCKAVMPKLAQIIKCQR
jgi:outer membrane usher protein